ncbi:MAG: transposase [Bacteroidota bacterium]
MADKYQNKYRIPSARLSTWDYSSNAAYFITLCTAKRQHYFGKIINGEMQLSNIGEKAHECWMNIPNHFQFVLLDAFVVMPNHMHGIIIIDKPVNDGGVVETGHALSLQGETKRPAEQQSQSDMLQSKQPHPRFRNQGKNTISAMVGSFKSAVTKWCNENKLPFGWQSRFHDHIIRDNDEFHRIRNYILNNPANWNNDKFFSLP